MSDRPDRTADVYLQFTRARNGWPQNSKMRLASATSGPPTSRRPGGVLVKVRVTIPDAAFDPAAIPALVTNIPLDLVHPPQDEIEVLVEDANPEED